MSAEVAEESDPSTTVFPTGRTCVLGAECRSASGTGFSGSTFLLRFVQSSGLCTVSSTGNPCSPGGGSNFLASISHVLSHMPKSFQAVLIHCISFSDLQLSVFPRRVRHKISFSNRLSDIRTRCPAHLSWAFCKRV